ncbi:MAG: TIGR00289 family protein [Candidatus Hydrothermarchaeales archaeon]
MKESLKAGALVSGGKDSIYAMYLASHNPEIDVIYMMTALPEREDSYMFHHPNAGFTSLQAEAMGLPVIQRRTPGVKEEELEDLKAMIESAQVETVVTGALASEYQRKRITDICEGLGIACISPLWERDPLELWEEELALGFEIIITSVSAEGLDEKWLGRKVDPSALKELVVLSKKHRFHLGFEGGEAETFVLDMPLFKKQIEIIDASVDWDGVRGVYHIEDARLVDKRS